MPLRTKSQWFGVVLDAPDARELAHFYARLLGWRIFSEADEWAVVSPSEDAGYNLAFATEKNYVRPVWPTQPGQPQMSMHLDVEVDDLKEAVTYAEGLGAEQASYQPQETVRVMLDPAGHHSACTSTRSRPADARRQGRNVERAAALDLLGGELVADVIFEHPRLVAIYDALDPDRSDLDLYAAVADELGARRALDVGCGTGTFALLLADRGLDVTAVDPASGSLGIARSKPGAERVRWIHGDATALPVTQVDLATMTGNVAQAIVEPPDWVATLRGVHEALRPGGHLLFETRNPAYRGWQEWNRAASYRTTQIAGVGAVETWVELTDVSGPLVSFRATWVFASDGQVLTSDSTLRFRDRGEVESTLLANGYAVVEVRDAPDRPGRELVFLARRTS